MVDLKDSGQREHRQRDRINFEYFNGSHFQDRDVLREHYCWLTSFGSLAKFTAFVLALISSAIGCFLPSFDTASWTYH